MRLKFDSRGRLTLPDIVMLLFGFAALAGLYPVYSELVARAAPQLDPMTLAAVQILVPGAALLLMAIVVGRATGGLR